MKHIMQDIAQQTSMHHRIIKREIEQEIVEVCFDDAHVRNIQWSCFYQQLLSII